MMKKIKIFLYGDYEKEEKWLNLMSSKGYNLINKKGIVYYFSYSNKCFFYKKDYLSKQINGDFLEDYIKLNDDNGTQFLFRKGNWFYFRRETVYGELELYTDKESKLIFLNRVKNIMIGLITFLMIFFEVTFDKINNPTFLYIYIIGYIILALIICMNFVPILKEIIRIKNK